MKFVNFAAAALSAALMAGAASAQTYPARELNGIIMWGAGGATDVVARAVAPHAEAALGKTIVMQNRAGAGGAIPTAYVNAQPSDGYTLLMGAENPQLFRVLGLSELDYKDFYPVSILGRGVAVIVVRANAPWKTFKELTNAVQKEPGKLKMGSTGPGGVPHVVGSLIGSVTPFKVTSVPFDGEGPGLTALQGGHVDFMPAGAGAVADHVKAGRLRALAVVDTGEMAMLPGVPPITKDFPAFAKYLPWGPFYGVWVKRDVPAEARAKLEAAFKTAAANPQFVKLMQDRGNVMMGMSGAEADAFLKKWQSVTAWLMQEAGAAKKSPADLGIPRP